MSLPVIKIKAFLPWGILALLVAFYLLGQSLWLKRDSVPPYNDSAHHLANYRVALQSLEGSLIPQHKAHYKARSLYAPAYYYFSALVSLFFGDTDLIHIPVNLFFFAVLLIAVYASGKKLFGAREGMTACLLLSFYPYIYGSTRIFLLELALCSLAALCVCFLLYSEELRKPRFTVAAAVVCLLGMLTKQSFLIYVAGPLVLTIGKALARRDAFMKTLLLICVGIVLPVILSFNPGTIDLLRMHFFRDAPYHSPDDPWVWGFYYFLLLPGQMNTLNVLVFIIGFAGYVFAKVKSRGFVLAWLLTPLIILTLDPLRSSKYSLPLLPVIALISSWGFYAIVKKPIVRYAILSVVLGFGVFVHYALLWDIRLPVNPLTGKRMSLVLAPYTEYVHKPRNKHLDKVQAELFEVLRKHIFLDRVNRVGVAGFDRHPDALINSVEHVFTDNYMVANARGMMSFILRHRLPFIARKLWKISDGEIPKEISRLDFLVAGIPLKAVYPRAVPFFDLITTLDVPSDGSKIYVYEKNGYMSKIQTELFKAFQGHMVPGGINHVGVTGGSSNGLIHPNKFRFTDNFIVVDEWGLNSFASRHQLPFGVHQLKKIHDHNGREGILTFDFLATALPLAEFFSPADLFFDLIATLDVPSDGSKIYLYARKKTRGRSEVLESQWAREASADLRIQKAQAAFREKRYKDSIKELKEFLAVQDAGGHFQAVAYVGLASNYVEMMVRDAAASKDYFSKADHYFNEALKAMDVSDPLGASAYSGLGYLYLSQRYYDRALSYLSRGLAYYPREGSLKEHGDLLTNQGYCYLGMKDPAKARDSFTQAVAVLSNADYGTLKGALMGLELCSSVPERRKSDQ